MSRGYSIVRAALPKEFLQRAYAMPEKDLAWPWREIPAVLDWAATNEFAVLGADVCAIENGTLSSAAGVNRFRMWDTKPQKANEEWGEYCRRALNESLAELADSKAFTSLPNADSYLHVVPTFVVPEDPLLFVPRDKHDHARAELAIAAGYPAVEPVLPELLEWLQDYNWPVAQTLEPFLSSIGLPLAPHLRNILRTGDEIWKYWIIRLTILDSQELAIELMDDLRRIASSPTEAEKENELDTDAKEALSRYGLDRNE